MKIQGYIRATNVILIALRRLSPEELKGFMRAPNRLVADFTQKIPKKISFPQILLDYFGESSFAD